MRNQGSNGRISAPILSVVVLVSILVLVLIFIGIKSGSDGPLIQDFFGNLAKKAELLAAMRINLHRSSEAEKSAVMADTDEASMAFADQSRRAAEFVERDRQELGLLLARDHTDKELALSRELDACWTELQKIDHEILDFAVQNTNLKAAALSFSKGREAMNRFEGALKKLIHGNASAADSEKDNRIVILAANAVAAGFNILSLHAPHIIEARDSKMDEIEAEMQRHAATVETSLQQLTDLISDGDIPFLDEAKAAYAGFKEVTAEVVGLSRANTNVKSFELSLGRKRKIAASCDEILISLQEAVRSTKFKATR
ncbi:MAG: hypothetical protein AB9873_10280 [Syntrophobacteraceae bacterium]